MDEQTEQQNTYQKKAHPDEVKEKTNTGPEISNTEWGLVIGALLVTDILQIGLDLFFGSGIALNRFIDIFVGMAFGLYLQLRGQLDSARAKALIATFIGEEIPGVDVLPFWVLDGIYSFYAYRKNKEQEKALSEDTSPNKLEKKQ